VLLANKWSGHLGAPYGQVVWTVKFSLRSSGLYSQVLLAGSNPILPTLLAACVVLMFCARIELEHGELIHAEYLTVQNT
jgi:hypothetical protein